jgi:GT2 family glycosyltransferase
MHPLHVTLEIVVWVIALAWLAKLIEASRGSATIPNLLAAQYDSSPEGSPAIVVIVPARNEASDVAACLESLLKQDYPRVQIIAVDDRSTDDTGTIMDAVAGRHRDRLEVMHIEVLPPGWLGKTHAISLAARHAIATSMPDYLLFTDADVLFKPDALRRALVEAVASRADHFIVLPTTLVKTRGEGLFLAFIQVMSLWAVRPWRVADPRATRDAIGVGAFNLVRTTAYQQLGGFDAAPMEILEDLTLGRRVKRAGLRQRVAVAPKMVSVHWAAGVGGLVNGMTKNAFAVFRFSPAKLLAAVCGIALLCISPVASLAFEGGRWPAAIGLVSASGLYLLSSRTTRISAVYVIGLPAAALLVIYSMIRSMVVTVWNGGVTWRGTFYPLDELRKHAEGGSELYPESIDR